MKPVREPTHVSDRVSTGGGCEAAVVARRCWWAKTRESDELLNGRRCPLKLKRANLT